MFGFFKKKQIAIDESINIAVEEFWKLFQERNEQLLSLDKRMEAAHDAGDDDGFSKISDEYGFISEQIQEQLWKMIPPAGGKLFFSPNPGELISGRYNIFVSSTRDCEPIKELIIRLMPADLQFKWEIDDLGKI